MLCMSRSEQNPPFRHPAPPGNSRMKLPLLAKISLLLSLLLTYLLCISRCAKAQDLPTMPMSSDYALMGWAEQFPGHTPDAPWQRCILTGRYAMVLDTQTMQIPHFGAIGKGLDYASAARADNNLWRSLPPADLRLTISVGGKKYRCTAGGELSRHAGPRLIESGRFLQRADVTDLVFTADAGEQLSVEARFETVAWPDRLSLILFARPGIAPLPVGEKCFGRIGGGFGLDGTNHLEIPHEAAIDTERFTFEFWAYIPTDYRAATRACPWIACKNYHEHAPGNYGILMLGDKLRAVMNIGGGRENKHLIDARNTAVKFEAWNHLALSYDGDTLRFYVNGRPEGENQIGQVRKPGTRGLAFGRRQDGGGDGYHFRGAVDEIRFYDRALSSDEIRHHATRPDVELTELTPVRRWNFDADVAAAVTRPRVKWSDASMDIQIATGDNVFGQHAVLPHAVPDDGSQWQQVALSLEFPEDGSISKVIAPSPVTIEASSLPDGKSCPVEYDRARSWHRIDLDGVEPIVPADGPERQNDAMERVKLVLRNPTDTEQVARLLFDKNARGIHLRHGAPITGISAILRDADGNPTGLPVQLSKNWHNDPQAGVYAGAWFHGFTQLRLPPGEELELELTIVYAHWGGVAAASHAQLSLIGWGSNQLWEESALGSWGESICYEPDQAQGRCAVLDVRPAMVKSMHGGRWSWTHNVGGGDFFRLFDKEGQRIYPGRMRAVYRRHGPCLTEVTHTGRTGRGITQSATVSIARTDDIVRGVYRLRLDVTQPVDFSRFVIFQIGADTYSYTGERKMAVGDATGLGREWPTQWGGDTYRTEPIELIGSSPWMSLHEAVPRIPAGRSGAWANRGFVIRRWDARLGGKKAAPWVAEHGVNARSSNTSTADIVPPPGVTRLLPGDYVEATIEHIVMPQSVDDYYGPNQSLRDALSKWQNTWRMIHREAAEGQRRVTMKTGTLVGLHPAVRVETTGDRAELTSEGGIGYVPFTFSGLTSHAGYALYLDGQQVDQSTHGQDFWQTDYDLATKRWEMTFNLPLDDSHPHVILFEPNKSLD